jgi:hypothetical protein
MAKGDSRQSLDANVFDSAQLTSARDEDGVWAAARRARPHAGASKLPGAPIQRNGPRLGLNGACRSRCSNGPSAEPVVA